MSRKAGVLIGKDVYIRFEGIDSDPFAPGSTDGKELVQIVCGAMNINKNRCMPSYDKRSHCAVLMFHFDRPSWAIKAAARAEAITYKGAQVSIADSIPEL